MKNMYAHDHITHASGGERLLQFVPSFTGDTSLRISGEASIYPIAAVDDDFSYSSLHASLRTFKFMLER
jgi:hypothetical protein